MISRPFIYYCFICLLVGFSFPAPLLAQDQPTAFLPEIQAQGHKKIAIPLVVSKVDNLAGLKVVISYDQEILAYQGEHKAGIAGSLMHLVNAKTPGTLVLVMAGARGIALDDQPIIQFLFKILPESTDKTENSTLLKITEIQVMNDQLKTLSVQTGHGNILY